ncbi:hypothetical protein COE15_20850 [Bacillus cereus]|jgi:hypothetical protein|uniref:hypothetical protein n=1 Tax=Bacillus TaxID=1386 RepID=UPI000BF59A3A|nr:MULTISPECIES: hypothetical protein [Bacillus]PFD96781.1 hypothetical protein CN288_23485 [Bacillus sp. AFS023182]PFW89266.1 hypothetical protein COL29_25735 [Bacillus pseudomycoides]PFX37247.1 hypothetical protein COL32_27455 [Bacillus pseudomycoides]PGX95604.1 hypothetical protein COE15_20850 [Bacillus cereus]
MTLSQGIIKKWLLIFVLCFSMFFVFFPQSKADAASSSTVLDGYGTVSSAPIYITSPYQKLNFQAINYRSADVKMWVKNDTTGGVLFSKTLWSEGSRVDPRNPPYTNLKNGKYRIYLQCDSLAPCYASAKIYTQ